jgi:cytoskeletal protein RodZ
MDDIRDIFKKYIKPIPNPNALSFAMVGLSTLMLVYFVAYNEDPKSKESPSEESASEESASEESPSEESPSEESPSEESLRLDESARLQEKQITDGGSTKRRHKKNKKTKRRKL